MRCALATRNSTAAPPLGGRRSGGWARQAAASQAVLRALRQRSAQDPGHSQTAGNRL